jgi:hypothetical protein
MCIYVSGGEIVCVFVCVVCCDVYIVWIYNKTTLHYTTLHNTTLQRQGIHTITTTVLSDQLTLQNTTYVAAGVEYEQELNTGVYMCSVYVYCVV